MRVSCSSLTGTAKWFHLSQSQAGRTRPRTRTARRFLEPGKPQATVMPHAEIAYTLQRPRCQRRDDVQQVS